jgi:uncharacterized Zn finger protein (UPF0148 family)
MNEGQTPPWPLYRCPRCRKPLFAGYLVGIIICAHCKHETTLDMTRFNQYILKALHEELQRAVVPAVAT